MSDNYKFFSHKECEYFPCHKVKDTESFNCLFCYCPLYALGNKCGGNFRYNDRGIKDCTGCIIPHKKESYEYIVEKFGEISKIARQNKE